ncbi:S-adenosyl-L-methionine-dependent methyltransferase [Cubamyces lactineus]|nr:S-adenosyl-L-methionine-dependent methyltransferase [Cubamyces lactineus]
MDSEEPYFDQSDDDGTSSDVSDDVVEVRSDEIPQYFEEREGRLFHSHGSSPYPLPVDADEQQRQNGLNRLLRKLIGDLSVGPVRELLTFATGEQRRVVDLGTGTGQWVLDMAREFPHVRFYGVDIVPIATRYPPRNVIFELHDIMEPFRYASGTIDMVHARSISMAIRDYRALLQEVGRILRRGGLFVSCEWSRVPAMADGSDITLRAPRTHDFFAAVRDTLQMSRGITSVARHIPHFLEETRQFTNIEAKRFHAPIGDWPSDPEMKAMGREFREMMIVYARSMKEVLLGGPYAADAEELTQGYLHDIHTIPGIVSTCFTVHARRI